MRSWRSTGRLAPPLECRLAYKPRRTPQTNNARLAAAAVDYGEEARPLVKATLAEVLASSSLYLQHGFGYEEGHDDSQEDGPIRSVLRSQFGSEWEDTLLTWIKDRPWFNATNSEVTRHCLVNGKFSPVTCTHFDPYLNVALVLRGKKTFWCAPFDAVNAKLFQPEQGTDPEWNRKAHDVVPDQRTSIPRYAAACRRFTKFEVGAGEVLVLPPNVWHYVVSDPSTIMLNWWWKVAPLQSPPSIHTVQLPTHVGTPEPRDPDGPAKRARS